MLTDRSLVLIVSPDAGFSATASRTLEGAGYALAHAGTGAQALEAFQRHKPHLVALDAALPDMDGAECCAKLRALPGGNDAPVVMVDRNGPEQGRLGRALEAGAVDYVGGPFEAQWALLSRRIQYLIRAQHMAEALEQERNQWRTLIDNVPDYIYVKNAQSRFVTANAATALGMGASSPADLLGKTDADFYPPDLAASYLADEQALLKSGQPVINREEPALDRAGGKTRWLLTNKIPLKNGQGKIIGLVGIGRDVTDRRLVEQSLERERALLRTLIDNVPDYIFAKDRAGRFMISNVAHALAVKTTAESLVCKTAFDVFPKHMAARFHADDEAIMSSGEPLVNADRRTVNASGAERRVLTTKVPMKDEKGEVVGLVGISRDVTEQKVAEEALAQERALLHLIIDSLPDNIFVKDTEGRIIAHNAAHAKLWGLDDVSEGIGKSDFDFFSDELASTYTADDRAVMESGTALINHEEKTVDAYGNEKWLLTTKVPMRNAEGAVVGIIGINRDITDLKRAEEVLNHKS
ncbi:MAG: PAS domain-containing protein [Anaerolineae bacterium]|nr:PAS domain-containing protein [Anaerolineae bacterium]